jgi:GLPGLI family protein
MKAFCCCILFMLIGKICIGQRELTINYEFRPDGNFGNREIHLPSYWLVINDSVSFSVLWLQRVDTSVNIVGKKKTINQSLYRNYHTNSLIVSTDLKNTRCRVSDSIAVHKWKFVDGAQKTILGYECSKATLIDSAGRKIIAWYTKELPALFGPTIYDGLPGTILQVVYELGNSLSITATSVSYRQVQVVEPTDGKLMTMEEYSKKNKGKPFF